MKSENYIQYEKIKLSYLKNRGDAIEVADELNLPVKYIKKVIYKIKKQEDRDVSVLISNTLMSHILLGSKSRVILLTEMLKSLESTEKPLLSFCHEMPVEIIEDSFKTKYKCIQCKKYCEVTEIPEVDIYAVKNDIITQLREEDKNLIELASKMGYTNRIEPPPAPVFKQNILVMGQGTNPQIMQDIQLLPPIEREKLMEKLKREMLNFNNDQLNSGQQQ